MSADRELTLTRLIDAPREKLYRAWTDPSLLKQWFAPLPYTTPVAELDVRPGGSAFIDGWYGYVKRDLPSPRYCGGGDVAACSKSLWAALDAAGNELTATQGGDPTAWRADANAERIRFAPGLLPLTMRWTNRPTFQQLLSFDGHR